MVKAVTLTIAYAGPEPYAEGSRSQGGGLTPRRSGELTLCRLITNDRVHGQAVYT